MLGGVLTGDGEMGGDLTGDGVMGGDLTADGDEVEVVREVVGGDVVMGGVIEEEVVMGAVVEGVVVAGRLLGGGDWTHLVRWPVGGGGRGTAPAGPALEAPALDVLLVVVVGGEVVVVGVAVLRVGLRDMLLEGEVMCPDGGVGRDGGEEVLGGATPVTLFLERTVDRFLADRLMLLVASVGGVTGDGADGGGGGGGGADGDGAELGVICMGE